MIPSRFICFEKRAIPAIFRCDKSCASFCARPCRKGSILSCKRLWSYYIYWRRCPAGRVCRLWRAPPRSLRPRNFLCGKRSNRRRAYIPSAERPPRKSSDSYRANTKPPRRIIAWFMPIDNSVEAANVKAIDTNSIRILQKKVKMWKTRSTYRRIGDILSGSKTWWR